MAKWYVVYEQPAVTGRVSVPNPSGRTPYRIFQATSANAAKNADINAGGIPTTVSGPYASEEAAKSAADSVTKKDEAAAHTAENQTFPDPLKGIDQVGVVIEAFYRAVTDGKMWRSLGWLWLGVSLLIVGMFLWLKKSGVMPNVVPVPV